MQQMKTSLAGSIEARLSKSVIISNLVSKSAGFNQNVLAKPVFKGTNNPHEMDSYAELVKSL